MVVFTSPFLLAGLVATTFGIGLAWGGIAVLRAPPKAGGGATAEPETWTTMPNSPLSRLVGGLLVATGLPVALLGGLCTGGIVLPETVLLWNAHRLWSIADLWAVIAGGGLTVTVGVLMARAGLRRIRGVRSDGSDPKQGQ